MQETFDLLMMAALDARVGPMLLLLSQVSRPSLETVSTTSLFRAPEASCTEESDAVIASVYVRYHYILFKIASYNSGWRLVRSFAFASGIGVDHKTTS